MICQQVTLSGDAEWPKVADAMIEAVKDILTTSAFHSRGIKVRLTTGEVGRVQEIVETNHTQVRDA